MTARTGSHVRRSNRNFQTNRTLLTAAALTEIIGNKAPPKKLKREARRVADAPRRDGPPSEKWSVIMTTQISGDKTSPNCRCARNDEHVQIHSVAAGQNGPVSRAAKSRRSERKSRALAARGHRGVDCRPAANLQRVTAALSAGSQVVRFRDWDRPTRTSFTHKSRRRARRPEFQARNLGRRAGTNGQQQCRRGLSSAVRLDETTWRMCRERQIVKAGFTPQPR